MFDMTVGSSFHLCRWRFDTVWSKREKVISCLISIPPLFGLSVNHKVKKSGNESSTWVADCISRSGLPRGPASALSWEQA